MPLLVCFNTTWNLGAILLDVLLVAVIVVSVQRQQHQKQNQYSSIKNYFQDVQGIILSLLLLSKNNRNSSICFYIYIILFIIVMFALKSLLGSSFCWYICLLLSTIIISSIIVSIQQQPILVKIVKATKSDTIVQVPDDNNFNSNLDDTSATCTTTNNITTNCYNCDDDTYISINISSSCCCIHSKSTSNTTATNNNNNTTTTMNNDSNTTTTTTNITTIRNVPFLCVYSYYNNINYQQILYQSLLQLYTNDTNTILKQLSISLEMISTTRNILLYEQIQKKIQTLSTIYDIDYTIIKNYILQPFSCQLMLVDESSTSTSTSASATGVSTSTTNTSSCIGNNTNANIESILNQEQQQYKEQYTNCPPIRYRTAKPSMHDSNDDDTAKRSSSETTTTIQAYDNIGQIIAHLVRDWSSKGQSIRYSLYNWCIEQIIVYHSISTNDTIKNSTASTGRNTTQQQKHQHHVLIPGAGLGRLAYDISINKNLLNSITSIEALECSISMAATASNIIFNRNSTTGSTSTNTKIQLHPYSLDYLTNEVNSINRYETVTIPDIDIITTNNNNSSRIKIPLSYTVTDFSINNPYLISDYKNCYYTTIVTCYFIDTATNILEYIDLIYMLLSTNGIWINVGPLQWHYNTILQLSIDELQQLIINYQPPTPIQATNTNTTATTTHPDSSTSTNNNNTTNDNIIPVFEILEWSVDTTLVSYRGDDVDTNFDINNDDDDDGVATTIHKNTTKKTTQKPKQTTQQPRLTRYDGYYPLRFVIRKISN